MTNRLISLVIPTYNEEESIHGFSARVCPDHLVVVKAMPTGPERNHVVWHDAAARLVHPRRNDRDVRVFLCGLDCRQDGVLGNRHTGFRHTPVLVGVPFIGIGVLAEDVG